MNSMKCKGCGANLDFDGTKHILKCEYCGTVYKDSAKNQTAKEYEKIHKTAPTVHIDKFGDENSDKRPVAKVWIVVLLIMTGAVPILFGYVLYIFMKQKAWDDRHR